MNLAVTASAIALVYVPLLALERLIPARAPERVEWLNNGLAWLLNSAGYALQSALLAVLVTSLLNALGSGLIDLRRLPFWLGALIYLAAMDLGEYLFHRAQHRLPWLWAMHSLHHSDRAMNVTTTQRHFWLDPALKAVSVWLAVALLFRADNAILGVYALASFYHVVVHANLRLGFGPLSWLLNSPQYHRLHHSRDPAHFNTNFSALLPVFDLLSGAYRPPKRGEFPPTGLDEAVRSRLDVVIWPWRGVLAGRDREEAKAEEAAAV